MITPGHYYTLKVINVVPVGYRLDAGELGEVLLPGNQAAGALAPGDSVNVFIYLDTDDAPVATTRRPKACVGEFAFLRVVATTAVGAFLDWGLEKDVLVPFAEQHRPMREGHAYLVYLYLSPIDGRITATSKIDNVLDDHAPHEYSKGQSVDLILANSTDLGFKAIINHGHWGMLYKNEVHQRLSFGQRIKGYIKYIRPDGKIDLSLQSPRGSRDQQAMKIVNYLERQNGYAPLHDKSDPQTIIDVLGMSKGAFKKAIGNLYRQQVISIEEEGIRLLEQDDTGHDEESHVAPVSKSAPGAVHKPEPAASHTVREVKLSKEPVELYKILKFEGLADSGGEARSAVAEGLVKLNGQVETQKRKKVISGDVIEFGEITLTMQRENHHDE